MDELDCWSVTGLQADPEPRFDGDETRLANPKRPAPPAKVVVADQKPVLWLRPPGRALNELLRVRGAQKKAEIGQGGKFDKGHATQRVCEQRKNKLPQRGLPCQGI